MGLGIVALLLGMGAAGAGAYIGLATSRMLVSLPGGLPAMAPETVALGMFMIGTLTMLLGIASICHAADDDGGDIGHGRLAGAIPGAARRGPRPGGRAKRP